MAYMLGVVESMRHQNRKRFRLHLLVGLALFTVLACGVSLARQSDCERERFVWAMVTWIRGEPVQTWPVYYGSEESCLRDAEERKKRSGSTGNFGCIKKERSPWRCEPDPPAGAFALGALIIFFGLVGFALVVGSPDDVKNSANSIKFGSMQLVRTADRLTIDKGENVRKGIIATFILLASIGAGLVSCSVAIDLSPGATGVTVIAAPIAVVLIVIALLQSRGQLILDRKQGTLRLTSISMFGTSVRREVPLTLVRRSLLIGSVGAFWEFAIEFASGEKWRPFSSLQDDAYVPDKLQKFADQVNEFLGVSGMPPTQTP
jgi:hypothetical protein